MKIKIVLLIICLLSSAGQTKEKLSVSTQGIKPWRGIHLSIGNQRAVEQLTSVIPSLARLGVNVIVGEINYGYQYKSHPELQRDNAANSMQIKNLLTVCRRTRSD